MITRMREAGLIWPTVLAVAGLVVLINLGLWQWQRLAWKTDLLERLQRGAMAAPLDIQSAWDQIQSEPKAGAETLRFRRIRATGRFDHAREIHLWAGQPSGPAWQVITPLVLAEPVGQSGRWPVSEVLVMRGIVAQARKAPETRADGQVSGAVTVVGRLRVSAGANWAASAPDLTRNEWYQRDHAEMIRHVASFRAGGAGTPEEAAALFVPFAIEAEQTIGGALAPQPQLGALTLSNRHFEYALTWWGLALTLVGVYIAFAWGRLRKRGDGGMAAFDRG